MLTIISGTNRVGSNTRKIAQYYFDQLYPHIDQLNFISLEDIEVHYRSEELKTLEENVLIPTEFFLFVMPEYNGSFPGILKLFIDNTNYKKVWWYKKAILTGLGDGRGGNLRGLDQLTNVLNYLKVLVHPYKLPMSNISNSLNENGGFKSEALKLEVEQHILTIKDFYS